VPRVKVDEEAGVADKARDTTLGGESDEALLSRLWLLGAQSTEKVSAGEPLALRGLSCFSCRWLGRSGGEEDELGTLAGLSRLEQRELLARDSSGRAHDALRAADAAVTASSPPIISPSPTMEFRC